MDLIDILLANAIISKKIPPAILHLKGSVSSTSELPLTGNKKGDVWVVTTNNSEWVWMSDNASGSLSDYEDFGPIIDLSPYRTAADQDVIDSGKQAKVTASGMLKGDGNGGVSAAVAGTDYDTASNIVSATAAMTPTQAAQTRQNIGADTPEAVAEWLNEHVNPETGYVIDDSLTIQGAAADAKATGNKITEVKNAFNTTLFKAEWNPTITSGEYIASATGKTGSSNKYARTGLWSGYPLRIGVALTNSIYEFYLALYDAAANISTGDGFIGRTGYFDSLIYIPENAVKIVAVFRRKDQAVLTSTDISAISTALTQYYDYNPNNGFADSIPRGRLRQTVGLPEKWYFVNCVSPKTYTYIFAGEDTHCKKYNDYVSFPNNSAYSGFNGFRYAIYDNYLNEYYKYAPNQGYGASRRIMDCNLTDCSCLAIGDSTIAHGFVTQGLIDYFSSKDKTIALYGTMGTGNNKHEGRAGWSAQDYLTSKTYNGVTNPFYNPNSETFDFGYYMTNQGYTAPDFVVIQLGINDLYNYSDESIDLAYSALTTIINSVYTYSNSIKIIVNLPTPPNADQSKVGQFAPTYINRIQKFARKVLNWINNTSGIASAVRASYCHLILDPETDIRDNVHPTEQGYEKMAKEIVNQINCWQNGA